MAGSSSAEKRLVLVTMGMDHHPFQRLVDWSDAWLDTAAPDVEGLIQCGPARCPHPERSIDFLDFPELEARIAAARVIACHAGPGSIMMARWIGHRPVVVPRLAELGEVVDNHQVTFARQLAAQGEVLLAESEAAFREAMDSALAGPGPARSGADPLAMSEPIRKFDELVAEIVRTPRARAR